MRCRSPTPPPSRRTARRTWRRRCRPTSPSVQWHPLSFSPFFSCTKNGLPQKGFPFFLVAAGPTKNGLPHVFFPLFFGGPTKNGLPQKGLQVFFFSIVTTEVRPGGLEQAVQGRRGRSQGRLGKLEYSRGRLCFFGRVPGFWWVSKKETQKETQLFFGRVPLFFEFQTHLKWKQAGAPINLRDRRMVFLLLKNMCCFPSDVSTWKLCFLPTLLLLARSKVD